MVEMEAMEVMVQEMEMEEKGVMQGQMAAKVEKVGVVVMMVAAMVMMDGAQFNQ
ncbi:hypothetical protein N0G65_002641 [Providencia rettgeri]|nr:hypothetical protein [Providencia rettgeri]